MSGADPSMAGGELPVWRLLELGIAEPARAQTFVEALAEAVGRGLAPNTLIIVRPSAPYVSLGFHQSFREEIDPGFLERRRLPVLRRVEGGGTTYLDRDQLFYQLVYRDDGGGPGGPGDLAHYLAAPVRAARQLGLPASLRPPSDIVVGDRKVSGNAGGDWEGAHILVGGFLLRTDHRAMADLYRLPDPALRPLLRREIERAVSSWEAEAGTVPRAEELTTQLVTAFEAEGLFRVRPGAPTTAEEARFRSETLVRHGDPSWRELPPSSSSTPGLVRRIRIAGPRGLLVFSAPGADRYLAAVVAGPELIEAYSVTPGHPSALESLPPGAPERPELERLVASAPRFD